MVIGRQAPAISQLKPNGADKNYKLAEWNCGPATMAMVARSLGPDATFVTADGKEQRVSDLTDAQLINELGRVSGTEVGGTSFKGMRQAAASLRVPTDKTELWWSNEGERKPIDPKWIDGALAAGKQVVINGAFRPDSSKEQLLDHFKLVVGKTKNGSYIVNDSWTGAQRRISEKELQTFLVDNSIHDGLAMQIG